MLPYIFHLWFSSQYDTNNGILMAKSLICQDRYIKYYLRKLCFLDNSLLSMQKWFSIEIKSLEFLDNINSKSNPTNLKVVIFKNVPNIRGRAILVYCV